VHRSWLQVLDHLLRPARRDLERCQRERQRHLAERRPFDEARTRALADCEARIERARAVVFAANDGVVPATMTELEREWRRLSRPDPGPLMDLWARMAPAPTLASPAWVDRKPWRDADPTAQVEVLTALAADLEGALAALAALATLRAALAAWGTELGTSVRWRPLPVDADVTVSLLAGPLRAAGAELTAIGAEARVQERARAVESEVLAEVQRRFPERPLLAQGVAHAAFVQVVLATEGLPPGRPDPVAALRALWTTGYVVGAAGPAGVTLEIPPWSATSDPAASRES
jgi:hypothetical protein